MGKIVSLEFQSTFGMSLQAENAILTSSLRPKTNQNCPVATLTDTSKIPCWKENHQILKTSANCKGCNNLIVDKVCINSTYQTFELQRGRTDK